MKAHTAAQRAQEKLERKLRKARQDARRKARAAARRSREKGQNWLYQRPTKTPGPEGEKVSEEERLLILQMLESGKITVEQADQLLAALEGGDG
jgi:vacuolar-type H+-ATPase subunit H